MGRWSKRGRKERLKTNVENYANSQYEHSSNHHQHFPVTINSKNSNHLLDCLTPKQEDCIYVTTNQEEYEIKATIHFPNTKPTAVSKSQTDISPRHSSSNNPSHFGDSKVEEDGTPTRRKKPRQSTKADPNFSTLYYILSKDEEDEIITRAENYSHNVLPDPTYYIMPTGLFTPTHNQSNQVYKTAQGKNYHLHKTTKQPKFSTPSLDIDMQKYRNIEDSSRPMRFPSNTSDSFEIKKNVHSVNGKQPHLAAHSCSKILCETNQKKTGDYLTSTTENDQVFGTNCYSSVKNCEKYPAYLDAAVKSMSKSSRRKGGHSRCRSGARMCSGCSGSAACDNKIWRNASMGGQDWRPEGDVCDATHAPCYARIRNSGYASNVEGFTGGDRIVECDEGGGRITKGSNSATTHGNESGTSSLDAVYGRKQETSNNETSVEVKYEHNVSHGPLNRDLFSAVRDGFMDNVDASLRQPGATNQELGSLYKMDTGEVYGSAGDSNISCGDQPISEPPTDWDNICLSHRKMEEKCWRGQELVNQWSDVGHSAKQKKRLATKTWCFVTRSRRDSLVKLPEGTQLFKPHTKLVELVAHAIDGSPDGLLQVQQIYNVLQNKYPFFRYMDKSTTNSWRSSIRHALYQKWFRKVKLQNDQANSKGCFWTINRNFEPKEWSMPSSAGDISSCLMLTDIDLQPTAQSLAAVASFLDDLDSDHHDIYDDVLASPPDLHTPTPTYEPDPILSSSMEHDSQILIEGTSPPQTPDHLLNTPTSACDLHLPLSQNDILNLHMWEDEFSFNNTGSFMRDANSFV